MSEGEPSSLMARLYGRRTGDQSAPGSDREPNPKARKPSRPPETDDSSDFLGWAKSLLPEDWQRIIKRDGDEHPAQEGMLDVSPTAKYNSGKADSTKLGRRSDGPALPVVTEIHESSRQESDRESARHPSSKLNLDDISLDSGRTHPDPLDGLPVSHQAPPMSSSSLLESPVLRKTPSAAAAEAVEQLACNVDVGVGLLKSLKAGGMTCLQAREAAYSCTDVRAAEFSCEEVLSAGYAVEELKEAGYTLAEVRAAGVSLEDAECYEEASDELMSILVGSLSPSLNELQLGRRTPADGVGTDAPAPPPVPPSTGFECEPCHTSGAAPSKPNADGGDGGTEPPRGLRAKAHACANCHKARTVCNELERPCPRCVRMGLDCEPQAKVMKQTCVACRNSKVKCDLEACWPEPCKRCLRLGTACVPHEPMKRRPPGSVARAAAAAATATQSQPPAEAEIPPATSQATAPSESAELQAATRNRSSTEEAIMNPEALEDWLLANMRRSADERAPEETQAAATATDEKWLLDSIQ